MQGWNMMIKAMNVMKQWDESSPQKAPRVQGKSCSITIASSRDCLKWGEGSPYIVGVEVRGFSQPIWDNRVDDQD